MPLRNSGSFPPFETRSEDSGSVLAAITPTSILEGLLRVIEVDDDARGDVAQPLLRLIGDQQTGGSARHDRVVGDHRRRTGRAERPDLAHVKGCVSHVLNLERMLPRGAFVDLAEVPLALPHVDPRPGEGGRRDQYERRPCQGWQVEAWTSAASRQHHLVLQPKPARPAPPEAGRTVQRPAARNVPGAGPPGVRKHPSASPEAPPPASCSLPAPWPRQGPAGF